jgi:hypothetical protein
VFISTVATKDALYWRYLLRWPDWSTMAALKSMHFEPKYDALPGKGILVLLVHSSD